MEQRIVALDPNDARSTAFVLLLNGYKVRAEVDFVHSVSAGHQGSTKIERIIICFEKGESSPSDV